MNHGSYPPTDQNTTASELEKSFEMRTRIRKLLLPGVAFVALAGALVPSAVALAEEPADAVDTFAEVEAAASRPGPGRVHLAGAGTLEASGFGNVTLAGDIAVKGRAYGGTLIVKDYAGDAVIEVNSSGPRADSAQRDVDGATTVVIHGLNGGFEISGSRVFIRFERTTIYMYARGEGHALLAGWGWFRVNGGAIHRWAGWL
jgi:hypothetical protein